MDWSNPFPFALGGGPTDLESLWLALRDMVGGEFGPGPKEGIEDLARQVKAQSLIGAERAIERALLQHFPGLSTDALHLWESLLLTDGANSEAALRELVQLAWLPPKGATTPSLAEDLTAISSQLSIDLEDIDDTWVTIPGKYFAPADNVPPYGLTSPVGLTSAYWPNFASRDILRVVYALEGAEVDIPENIVRDVTRLLVKRLPSPQTWTLTTSSGPFLLDGGDHGESVLDLTPLG